EPAKAKLRVAVRAVERPRETSELERERRVVDAGRGRELGAEDPDTDPAEASKRSKPVAVAPRQIDGGGPVGMNAQLLRCHPPVVLACNEHDRHVVQRPRPTLEEAFGFTRCHSADVDAVDLHAGGNPSRRAGEGEPEAGSDG